MNPQQLVHVSPLEVDVRFVSKTIQARNLEPIPLANFTESDDWHCETSRWKRIFERYSWGGVLFISDRDEDEHYTMVVEGNLDLGTGVIQSGESRVTVPVSWYHRMALIFSETLQKSGRAAKIPPCLGSYQGDHVCDGGYNPRGQMEAACAWRDRCILLQGHCVASKKTPAEVIGKLPTEEIIRFTSRLIETNPPVTPPLASRAPVVPAVAAVQQAAEAKAKNVVKKPSVKKNVLVGPTSPTDFDTTLLDVLKAAVISKLPTVKFTDKSSAKPGELYFQTAVGYETLYMKKDESDKGRDKGIFIVMLQKSPSISLRMCLPASHAALSGLPGVKNMTKSDGQFHSLCQRLTSAEMGTVVEVLTKLVQHKVSIPK
jgi:hypothetical protein